MAQIDTKQQIFSESGGVIRWNETKGHKLVNTLSINENKRGFYKMWELAGEAGINIDTLLKEWGKLDFFLKGSVEASVGIRGQTPLNLFDGKEQAGLALQLQAIAQAAIAIGLEIDLTISQLIEELEGRPDTDDFQTQLLGIILQETKIEGVMYAQAAIAVMAYARLIITGSFFSNEQHEDGPGFKMIFDGGYGFIAGSGYRCYIQANMTNPGNLICRASDLTVTECMKKVSPFSKVRIMEAPLQMGLRLAYTLGENLRKNFITGDPRINQATIIIIEEGQRWFLHQFNKFARENMQEMISRTGVSTHTAFELLNILNERVISIDEMKRNLVKIKDLSLEIAPSLPPAYQEAWLKQTSINWASMNLYINISEQQLKETIEYYSFQGSIEIPESISIEIKKHLANPPSGLLQIEHLMIFLFENTLSALLEQQSDISYVIDIYKTVFPGTDQEVLQHLFNFKPSNTTSPDKDTLAKLYNGLNTFYQTHMMQIEDLLEKEIPANTELVYVLTHSILPSLALILDVVIPEMLNGFQSGEDKKENMIEALSSTLLPVVGRTLIQIQDGILSKTKGQLVAQLRKAAEELNKINLYKKYTEYHWEQIVTINFRNLHIFPKKFIDFLNYLWKNHNEMFIEYISILINLMNSPIQEALKTMATLIEEHPYPTSIFNDMEEILTPINNWKDTKEFYNDLAKTEWIPQEPRIIDLLKDVAKYMFVDMKRFNDKMVTIMLEAVLTKLYEDIELAIKFLQFLLITLLKKINIELTTIAMKLLEKLFKADPNLNKIYSLTVPFKDKVLQELNGQIQEGINKKILPDLTSALNNWTIDARVIIEDLRGKELNSVTFSSAIIKQIEKRLIDHFKDTTLSINVNININPDDFGIPIPDIPVPDIPVPDIPIPHVPVIHGGLGILDTSSLSNPFHFESIIHIKSTTFISKIINQLPTSPIWEEEFKNENFEDFINLVYFLEEYHLNYKRKTMHEKEKEYLELTRSLPIAINIKDMLLIVQPHIEHKDYMEIFIHFPDNNVRADNIIIKLNETEIPLDCFTFHKNTRFLNRQNNVLLYGVTPFDKLKSNINTLHVFYKNIETMLSFNIE
ncbi:TPA: hypothetical protein ACGN81_005269 [Bacillus cereus]